MWEVGDKVQVDITGIYQGWCEACRSLTTVIPGGGCSTRVGPKETDLCAAGEDRIVHLRDFTADDFAYPD